MVTSNVCFVQVMHAAVSSQKITNTHQEEHYASISTWVHFSLMLMKVITTVDRLCSFKVHEGIDDSQRRPRSFLLQQLQQLFLEAKVEVAHFGDTERGSKCSFFDLE